MWSSTALSLKRASSGRLNDLADYFAGSLIARACRSHVDCIAANTPHLIFDEVQRDSFKNPERQRGSTITAKDYFYSPQKSMSREKASLKDRPSQNEQPWSMIRPTVCSAPSLRPSSVPLGTQRR